MKLNLKWVSETIGEDYKKWKQGDIVKIQAQTGTGKTYFIKKVLIPHMESWERMLIVANRINLKRQLKKDLITYYNEKMPESLKELDDLTTIGNITILSYQSIAELRKADNYGLTKMDLDNYDYIICDECHFFFSDGSFNNKCSLAWDELIKTRHRKAIKIFISATMEEVEYTINMSVDKIREVGFGSYSRCNLFNYSTGIDYKYLDTYYFKSIKDLATTIKNDKSGEKWLVFVTQKDDAAYIKEYLENYKTVSIITKDTDINNNEDLKSIITNSKFNSNVLICTKAMDNGINIEDIEVKNIVIMAWDKISFIQELGRVRINIEDAPIIKLYIPTMSWSAFNTLIKKQYEIKEDLIKTFREDKNKFNCKYNYEYNKLPNDIFILDENGWKINSIGEIRLINDKHFAQAMCKKFKGRKDIESKVFAYVKEQLIWINQVDKFDMFRLIEEVVDDTSANELKEFLDNAYENDEKFTKEYFIEKVINTIKNDNSLKIIWNKLDGGHSRSKGIKKFNELFNKLNLPYLVGSKVRKENIDGKRKNITYWSISGVD